MIATSSFREGAQFAVLGIGFDLGVPRVGVKLDEPISKQLQFFRVEVFYLILETFNSAHAGLHTPIIAGNASGILFRDAPSLELEDGDEIAALMSASYSECSVSLSVPSFARAEALHRSVRPRLSLPCSKRISVASEPILI